MEHYANSLDWKSAAVQFAKDAQHHNAKAIMVYTATPQGRRISDEMRQIWPGEIRRGGEYNAGERAIDELSLQVGGNFLSPAVVFMCAIQDT